MLIELDEGYSFGLGLFETILLYKGKPVFLDEHLARINKSIVDLGWNIKKLEKDVIFSVEFFGIGESQSSRFVTSWATKEEDVDKFVELIKAL